MRVFFKILGCFFLIASVVSFLYYWDSSRIYFMSLKSKNSFAFGDLPKEITDFNLAATLHLQSSDQVSDARDALQQAILGYSDLSRAQIDAQAIIYASGGRYNSADCDLFHPSANLTFCEISHYSQWDALQAIERLDIVMAPNYIPKVFVFYPAKTNGKLVLYHHGYAGTFNDQHVLIRRLVEAGYSVAAFNMTGYGDNILNRPSPWIEAINGDFAAIDHPLRVFFHPIIATMNYLQETHGFKHIAMMGVSAGGWATAVTAALDPRIVKSYPVAGVLPIGLRHGDKERAAPQYYPPMLAAASYLDMFVLASDRPGRSQMQFFNRYDRCCFNNVRGKLYEKIVASHAEGGFSVLIDETHARHKISSWAFDHILQDMQR